MEKAEKAIRIPVSAAEVTPDWLSSILGQKIDPSTFLVATNAQEGKGFLSNMLRVSCKKEETREDVNVIIKLIPEESYERSIVMSQRWDKIEILVYKEVIPAFVRELPSLADYICPFVFGKYEDESKKSVLVLEDLKPLGYGTFDFGENISDSQIDQGLDFLAKLHFAGAALKEKEGKGLEKIFDFLAPDNEERMSCFKPWLQDFFPLVTKLFSESQLSESMKKAYGELGPFLEGSLVALMRMCIENPCLVHGDLWTNNILYNRNPSLHPKVIDWQVASLTDIGTDVAVFIMTSLSTENIRDKVILEKLKKYYDLHLELCSERGMSSHYLRNWEEFLEFFNTFGLLWVLLYYILSVPAFQGKDDRRMLRAYEYLYEKGIVEFAKKIAA